MGSNVEKILDVVQIGLHLFSIAEADQAKAKMAQAIGKAREGKIKEAGEILVDAVKGEGFGDEQLHRRAVRATLEPGEEKERYLEYVNRLDEEEPAVYTSYILAIATETDQEERRAIVKEFATCQTYNAFRALINSYRFNRPQTPLQKNLFSLVEAFKTGLKKAGEGIATGAKTAGEGIETGAKAAGQAIKEKNDQLDTNLEKSGFVTWTAKIRAKAEKMNENKS
ncbi:hypothetical protein GYA13_04225 [Candidatus Kuenenbacteria bacterium]|nr:hypothetical protein [Candidatus Kuenenbacteria bacterium]